MEQTINKINCMTCLYYHRLFFAIMAIITAMMVAGCSEDVKPVEFTGVLHCLRFTDAPDFSELSPEIIVTDAEAQTLTLKIISVTKPLSKLPSTLTFSITEWDDVTNSWNQNTFPGDTNQEDDFYHVWTDKVDGQPVIKVSLKANDTPEVRKLHLFISSDVRYLDTLPVGIVEIIQSECSSDINDVKSSNKITAVYKGQSYTSDVEITPQGDVIYLNPEYVSLMHKIDSLPSIQMYMIGDDTVYYYDTEDISANRLLEDIENASETESKNQTLVQNTRGNAFEGHTSQDLGFFSVFDNDNFGGTSISKGLTNFHYTYNLPSLKPYGMNDKVTSIAVHYAGFDFTVCSVLTIWDDSDYNYGDEERKNTVSALLRTAQLAMRC